MLSFVTLASGSSGNAALVSCGQTHILLDAGISARRITTALRGLGVDPAFLSGVLITHEHTDHISGLATLTKQLGLPVYATAPTLDALAMKVPAIPEKRLGRFFAPGESFPLGELWIEPFATSHDAACSVGYAITGGDSRMVLCTDLGYISPQVERAVAGCDLLVCEANHDEEWCAPVPTPITSNSGYWAAVGICPTRPGLSWLCWLHKTAPAPFCWPICPRRTIPPPTPWRWWAAPCVRLALRMP